MAGAQTARLARPIKLSASAAGGVLTLKAEPAAALFLQHDSRALCARINSYLGRVAVTRLRFVQGTLAAPPPPPPKPAKPQEPSANDPVRRWQGPANLGEALHNLARRRAGRAQAI
ncbi:MAG TPA: DciA family protein [Rhizomicrobium sp.]